MTTTSVAMPLTCSTVALMSVGIGATLAVGGLLAGIDPGTPEVAISPQVLIGAVTGALGGALFGTIACLLFAA